MWPATILYAAAPFAIAYAVVRQRVFDISFVVSRTLVYTIVTAALFCIFSLVEWLTGRLVEHSGAAIAFVAVTAVGIAYSLHAVYGRRAVRRKHALRRRRLAERHIAEVAAGLPYAENSEAVEAALVREPMHAYALSSAQLFSRDDSGEYVGPASTLDRCIPLQLQGRRSSMRLHDGDPVLAVPVFVRSRLEAIVVHGAHLNGEDIDPDEAESLQALGAAAGTAYELRDDAGRARRRALAQGGRAPGARARRLARTRSPPVTRLHEGFRRLLLGYRSGMLRSFVLAFSVLMAALTAPSPAATCAGPDPAITDVVVKTCERQRRPDTYHLSGGTVSNVARGGAGIEYAAIRRDLRRWTKA